MTIPGGGSDSLQRLHTMRDLGATVLCCTPTYALRLAEVARNARIRSEFHLYEHWYTQANREPMCPTPKARASRRHLGREMLRSRRSF